MKKLVSILLVALMLVSALSVTAFADNYASGEYLYEDVFLENYSNYIGDMTMNGNAYYYRETYYHHVDENDPNSEIDWVLVNANSMLENCWLIKSIVKDSVFYANGEGIPFSFGVAIFDVKNQTFHELSSSTLDNFKDSEEIVLNKLGYGTPIGDADSNGKLEIIDATFIQLVSAKLQEYSKSDDISDYFGFGVNLDYISDMNRDGERDILDATAIQLKLAGLSDEPQYNEELVYVEYDEVRYPNTYPEKPEECVAPDYEVKVNSGYFGYSTKLGYPDTFMAVIKSKEQYEYIFEDSRYINYDEEIFETHWLVASMVRTTCGEGVAKISTIDVLGDTLYVSVDEYIDVPDDGMLTDAMLPFVSLVAVEKSELANVTNIVRVE